MLARGCISRNNENNFIGIFIVSKNADNCLLQGSLSYLLVSKVKIT